jgi:hypothetical protein
VPFAADRPDCDLLVTGSGASVTYGPDGTSDNGSVPMSVPTPLGNPSYYSIDAQLNGTDVDKHGRIFTVLRHPAVTAAIIGPRTMAHLESQLPAAEVNLPTEVLDRIDEIVPPGVTLNPADNGWVSPALQPAARRR